MGEEFCAPPARLKLRILPPPWLFRIGQIARLQRKAVRRLLFSSESHLQALSTDIFVEHCCSAGRPGVHRGEKLPGAPELRTGRKTNHSSISSLSSSFCANRWASSGYRAVMRFPSSTTNGFLMLPPCRKSLLSLSTFTVSSSTYS